jgi:hypothetical protein
MKAVQPHEPIAIPRNVVPSARFATHRRCTGAFAEALDIRGRWDEWSSEDSVSTAPGETDQCDATFDLNAHEGNAV